MGGSAEWAAGEKAVRVGGNTYLVVGDCPGEGSAEGSAEGSGDGKPPPPPPSGAMVFLIFFAKVCNCHKFWRQSRRHPVKGGVTGG